MGTLLRKTYTRPLPAGAAIRDQGGQRIAVWTDSRGRRCSAPVTVGRDGQPRITTTARTYIAKFRDARGIVREVSTGCRDRSAALMVLTELERTAEKVRAGVLTPAEAAAAEWQAVPVKAVVADYLQWLAAKKGKGGRQQVSAKHLESYRGALRRVLADCRFLRLRDLARDTILRWISRQQQEGRWSARTINLHLAALSAFGNWCVATGRLAANPFGRLPKLDEAADRRRVRRALTPEELQRLLYAAQWRPLAEFGRPTVRKLDAEKRPNKRSRATWRRDALTLDDLPAAVAAARQRLRPDVAERLQRLGRARALAYKVLVLTGLRYGELRSIRIEQVQLDGPLPCLRLAAGDAKSGQAAEIPLRGDLVADLRDYLSERAAALAAERAKRPTIPLAEVQAEPRGSGDLLAKPLFDLPAKMTRIFDRDLKLAGIAKRDDRRRSVDVHGLRHTFATWLSAGGVAPRTAQAALRHSTLELTMQVYTDPRLLDVAGALEVLPQLPLAASPGLGAGRPGAGGSGAAVGG